MNNSYSSRMSDDLHFDASSITIREHVDGCTIIWQRPKAFNNISNNEYKQQIVIREGIGKKCHVHTLIIPPFNVSSFSTTDGLIYDVYIIIKSEEGHEHNYEVKASVHFVAAKELSLKKRKNPKKIKTVKLKALVSALDCRVTWPSIVNKTNGILKIKLCTNGDWKNIQPNHNLSYLDILSIPGCDYMLELRKYHNNVLIIAGNVWFKATYSPKEMHNLFNKAFNMYNTSNLRQFTVYYRCKPSYYFDQIKNFDNSIMETYFKDLNGHSGSPINKRLEGLFFYARTVNNNNLPTKSPFGDQRWIVSAHYLYDPRYNNLYFADFYCTYATHYVTIVITKKNSESDTFCKKRLVTLDPENNCFLTAHWDNDLNCFKYYANMDLWLEFFYTENLSLNLGLFDKVQPLFNGKSSLLGLPNNKYCPKCNLYPHENNEDLKLIYSFTENNQDFI